MDLLPYINDFANRSFRDLADQDYIAARMCYRNELDQQFLWNALQAIEKYFKAILLYNGQSAKAIGHDLVKGLNRVEAIKDICFQLPKDVVQFINYLNDYGANRYLTHPTHLRAWALIELDRSVWFVRRYCFYMRGQIKRQDGTIVELLEYNVKKVHHPDYEKRPHKYKIFGGYLEEILKKKKPAAEQLVWKNFYFGRRKKYRVRNYKSRMTGVNPTHFVHPEIFSELDKIVEFPKQILSRLFCKFDKRLYSQGFARLSVMPPAAPFPLLAC